MIITEEFYNKVQGLELVQLRGVLINANRTDFGDDDEQSGSHAYDLGVKHGVQLLTDRILEQFGFERQEIQLFYKYAKALESEDPPVIE